MEIWRDIKEYKGKYQISTLGNVKSLDRVVFKNGKTRNIKSRILKPSTNLKGYKLVYLCDQGVVKPIHVHRLVCEAFIENKFNKSDVNHINGIKADNRLQNLEWATRSENIKHAYRTGLNHNSEKRMENFRKNAKDTSRKVIDLSNGFIFNSAKEASLHYGIKYITLNAQLNGRNAHKTPLRYHEKSQ